MIKATFTILLLLSLVHYASSVNFTSGFSISPVQVLNITNSTDYNFVNPVLASMNSNSSFAIFGINQTGRNYSFTRRIVDAYTFAQIGNDTVLPFNVVTYVPILSSFSPTGIVAMASVDKIDSISQIFISVFPANYVDNDTSTFTQIQITANVNTTYNYYLSQLFYQDGVFYLVYTGFFTKTSTQVDVYMQGVSANSPNRTYFSSPLLLNGAKPVQVDNLDPAAPYARCGQHGKFNMIYCMWKGIDNNTTVSVMVDLTNRNASAATALINDTADWAYKPIATVPYSNYCAQILFVSNVSSQDILLSMKVKVSYINPVYTLPYQLPSDMQQFTYAGAAAYYGGFFVVNNQYYKDSDTSETRSSVGVSNYQKDASMNGTQNIIARNGTLSSLLVQPNGAVYVLVTNTSRAGGTWDVAYLAQLYGSSAYPPSQGKFALDLIIPYISMIIVAIAVYMM